MSRPRRIFAILALALLLAPLLASAPLFDPDEGLHAAIAQEMVRTGDYVTPRFLGEPFLDKPILFFWAEAVSLRIFGMNEAAVRIPPLVFGLLGMLSVALLGRALFDERTGLVAGIAYATMVLPLGVSEIAVHDVAVVPFMCIAAWCLVRVADPASAGVASTFRWKIVAAGIALGLSILTKGLVAVVFAGILAACLAVYKPQSMLRLATALAIAIVIAIVVAAPWYIAMERAHPGYLYYYFVERHLQGYLTATQRHAGRPWWYYVPIVIGGTLPWTGYLAGALRLRSGQAGGAWRNDPRRGVLWGWFLIGLVFLSVGESKLATYALPLFPALAILAGEYVATRPRNTPSFFVHVLTLAVLPVAGLLALQIKYNAIHPYVWIALVLFALLTIDAGRRAMRSTSEDGFMAGVARMSIYALIGLMIVAPRAAAWMTGRDLAATLNTSAVLPPRVAVVDERIGSVVFYLAPGLRDQAGQERIDSVSVPEALQHIRVDPVDAVFAVRNNQLQRFSRLFAREPVPDAAAGTFTIFRADSLRAALQGR